MTTLIIGSFIIYAIAGAVTASVVEFNTDELFKGSKLRGIGLVWPLFAIRGFLRVTKKSADHVIKSKIFDVRSAMHELRK